MPDETVLEDKPTDDTPADDVTSSTPADSDVSPDDKTDPNPDPDASSNEEGKATDDPDSPQVQDWVETAARGDEKRLERLKRFTDPGALLDSYLSLEEKLSKRGVMLPGKDATEDEIKAFNKSIGVPETPDKYKVELKIPEGEELDEEDTSILSSATEALHKQGGILAHPQVVQAFQQMYVDMRAEADAQTLARAEAFHQEAQATMDKEWGAEKDRNVKFAGGVIDRFGEDGIKGEEGLLRMRMEDGTRLGDYMPFVRMMAKIGREYGDDPLFADISAKSGNALQTMQDRKAEIMSLRANGKFKEYDAAAEELEQIEQALARHTKRQP